MQEEVSKKSVALTVNASKFTAKVLYMALKAYLEKNRLRKQEKHGKMSVKKLVGQGKGASTIEINDKNIVDFIRIAKKYRVDFAVKRDDTYKDEAGNNKYLIFFKGNDTDVITQAFKEYVCTVEKKRNRQSIKCKIKKYKEKAAEYNKQRQREKSKHREECL